MQVKAEDKSLVVREGNLDRLRVPSGILAAAGAGFDSGDGIAWQVQDFGAQGILIVGRVVKGARSLEEFARKPPTPPQRAAKPVAPAKKGAKKGAAKGGAVALPVATALGSQFAEAGDDYLDDSPLPPVPVARQKAAAAVVPAPKAAAPVPRAAKKSAKKGAVAYQIPGALGSQFAD